MFVDTLSVSYPFFLRRCAPAFAGWPAPAGRTMDFESLTRRHGVKVDSDVSIEECSLAVGEVVGHDHVVSASRMNRAIVLFLSSVAKADEVIQRGVVIRDSLTPVLPMSSPSRKIILSNVPPFLKDEHITRELSRFGKLVSPIRKIPAGCKSPLLKHLMSFRRQVYMVLNHGQSELDLTIKFKEDGFDYVVFVTSNVAMKCFGCGKVGHLVRDCSKEQAEAAGQPNSSTESGEAVIGCTAEAPVSDDTTGHLKTDPLATVSHDGPTPSVETPPAAESPTAPLEQGTNAAAETEPVNESAINEGAALADRTEAKPPVTDCKVAKLISLEPDSDHPSQVQLAKQLDDLIADVVCDMETDTQFKVPERKRKSQKNLKSANKAIRAEDSVAASDTDGNVTEDSSWSECSQTDASNTVYKAEDIITFLTGHKGERGVDFEKQFPDLPQFVKDATFWMREGAIPKPEFYRLRAKVSKIRKQLRSTNASK